MVTVKYTHSSMFGTYMVPCKVKSKKGNKFFIEYFDNILEDVVEVLVNKDELEFPKYADMIM